MKLVPYHGVLVKEYVGEILKSFDKFHVVPSSMKVFTTNLNGPLSPTVSRPSEGRASRDTVGTGYQPWYWLCRISGSLFSTRKVLQQPVPFQCWGWFQYDKGARVNTLRLRKNGHHYADVYKCIFLNENAWIPLKISLKFVPRVPIDNISALIQIMTWRHAGDKPLSAPMMVSLLMHICVTRPQWVKSFRVLS